MKEYQKIETVFERDPQTKKLLIGKFRNPTVEYLMNNNWLVTEKIDGTNIRVVWDGHTFSFYGRTDKATIPVPLLEKLKTMFDYKQEQVFEQMFGLKEVILFGEGIGEKIQCGTYGKEYKFLVFDIMINGKYLHLSDSLEICSKLNLETVPIWGSSLPFITLLELIIKGSSEMLQAVSELGGTKGNVEGFVLRPKMTVYDNNLDRVIVKLKFRDFKEKWWTRKTGYYTRPMPCAVRLYCYGMT